MKMDESHRAETGAFYTPKPWADKAVECLLRHVPCLDGFTVYDPAAGEGSLLDALPEGTDCFGSTLESEDCGIMLRKGHACQQFDFLHNNFRFLDDTVLSASENGSLIVPMSFCLFFAFFAFFLPLFATIWHKTCFLSKKVHNFAAKTKTWEYERF